MIQTFEFYGSGRQINAQGRFFRYETGADGSGQTDIALTIDGNRIGVLQPGDDIELPQEAQRWDVAPVSNGCTGKVRIGNARVTSQKMQGVVQTVDGARARSLAGVAFAAYSWQGGIAGRFAQVQLWNKAGSGRVVIVNGATIVASSTAGIQMTMAAAAIGSFVIAGQSKKAGGAPSAAAETRVLSDTSTTTIALKSWAVANGIGTDYRPTEPIVLMPGTGLTFCSVNAGSDLGVSLDWFEENA